MFFMTLCIDSKYVMNKSSRSQMFFKVGFLKGFAIFTGKHLCWSLFLKQVFSCGHCKIQKNTFFTECAQCLLLYKASKQS